MRVGIISGENHGTNYYRGTLVKRAIDRWGAAFGVEAYHTGIFSLGLAAETDVLYLLRPMPETLPVDLLHRLKREGRPLVVDFDDDLFQVPTWSMSSQTFDQGGVRDYCQRVLECADVLTTTTRFAARRLHEIAPNAPVHVVPNAFDPSVRFMKPLPRWKAGDVPCVGWSGGSQHNEDLRALDPVWMECLRRGYGLAFIGDGPRSLAGRPGKVSRIQGHGNVEMYMQSMPLAGFDVAVAPLLDIPFNRAKSCLKAIEYSHLCGVPAVLSDLDPYEEIPADGDRVHKVRGFDVGDWMAAIEAGIETTKRDGRRYHLPETYKIASTLPLWLEAFHHGHVVARGAENKAYRPGGAVPVEVEHEDAPVGAC